MILFRSLRRNDVISTKALPVSKTQVNPQLRCDMRRLRRYVVSPQERNMAYNFIAKALSIVSCYFVTNRIPHFGIFAEFANYHLTKSRKYNKMPI